MATGLRIVLDKGMRGWMGGNEWVCSVGRTPRPSARQASPMTSPARGEVGAGWGPADLEGSLPLSPPPLRGRSCGGLPTHGRPAVNREGSIPPFTSPLAGEVMRRLADAWAGGTSAAPKGSHPGSLSGPDVQRRVCGGIHHSCPESPQCAAAPWPECAWRCPK
jgi:hypothetical protein